MKKNLFLFALLIFITSCIPLGKLNEALDANTMLYTKYDSLHNILNDTVASCTISESLLKSNIKNLKDSIKYYRALAATPPVLTEGDIFLNQILGLSLLNKSELTGLKTASGNNIWLDNFKADMKKYTAANADVRLYKCFLFVDISDEVLFSSGSSVLTNKSKKVLSTIASLLQVQPDLTFMIEGHTDNKAFKKNASNDNWSLSINRATTVARILQTKYRINPKRIIAAGRSQYVPLDDNKTKAGRLNNRRIRIVFMPTFMQVVNLK